MQEQGMNNSIHEKDGSIKGDESFGDLETTTSKDPRANGIVSPGYGDRQEYQVSKYKP